MTIAGWYIVARYAVLASTVFCETFCSLNKSTVAQYIASCYITVAIHYMIFVH